MQLLLVNYKQEVNVRSRLITALSIVVYIDAFMWLVGVIPTTYYAFTNLKLPTFAGIKLMGGPFERLGIEAVIVLGVVYIVVSGLKIMAAYWLWYSRRDGALLEIILLSLSIIFWYGFALPLGPLIGIIQVVLLALAWKILH